MKKLENYKGFAVVAWVTVILFSGFTYMLVDELNTKVDRLSTAYEVSNID